MGLVLPVDLFSPRAWAIFLLAMRERPMFSASGAGNAPALPPAPSAHGLARRQGVPAPVRLAAPSSPVLAFCPREVGIVVFFCQKEERWFSLPDSFLVVSSIT